MDPCCGLSLWAAQTAHPNRKLEVSDLYSAKVSEENQGALGMGARGRDRLTETNSVCVSFCVCICLFVIV